MIESQRRVHRIVWLVLGPLILVGIVLGIALR